MVLGDVAVDVVEGGERFARGHERDCQFAFSRVQHDWRKLDKDGVRQPTRHCQMKRTRKWNEIRPRRIPRRNGNASGISIRNGVIMLG